MKIAAIVLMAGLGLAVAAEGAFAQSRGAGSSRAGSGKAQSAPEQGAPGPGAGAGFEAEPQTPTGRFLTATEVKPILEATRAQWIAVRPYEGKDWLYFTNLLAWRCGLYQIRYAVNGGEMKVLEMEPCYDEEGAPNALKMDAGIMPFVTFPLNSVETIRVELLFDDLTEASADYQRAAVQIN